MSVNTKLKETEDALEHLARRMKDEFVVSKNSVQFYFMVQVPIKKEWIYKRTTGTTVYGYNQDLSLESIREIGQKIGYEVWAEPYFDGDDMYWTPCFHGAGLLSIKNENNRQELFYEALVEALISAIYDKFPKEQQCQ